MPRPDGWIVLWDGMPQRVLHDGAMRSARMRGLFPRAGPARRTTAATVFPSLAAARRAAKTDMALLPHGGDPERYGFVRVGGPDA